MKNNKTTAVAEVVPSSTCLDEMSYKTLESSHLSSFLSGEVLASDVQNRWQMMRKPNLTKHNAYEVILVDRETSKTKDRMEQFHSGNFQLVFSEHDSFDFVSIQIAEKPTMEDAPPPADVEAGGAK